VKRLNVHAEMVDGRVLEARTALKDYLLYETTAKRQKPPWGGISDNPSRWEAFVTWAALRRTGQFPGSFESFTDEAEIVDANAEEEVDPTTEDPGVDS
jgi:hypothetical protein